MLDYIKSWIYFLLALPAIIWLSLYSGIIIICIICIGNTEIKCQIYICICLDL